MNFMIFNLIFFLILSEATLLNKYADFSHENKKTCCLEKGT